MITIDNMFLINVNLNDYNMNIIYMEQYKYLPLH